MSIPQVEWVGSPTMSKRALDARCPVRLKSIESTLKEDHHNANQD